MSSCYFLQAVKRSPLLCTNALVLRDASISQLHALQSPIDDRQVPPASSLRCELACRCRTGAAAGAERAVAPSPDLGARAAGSSADSRHRRSVSRPRGVSAARGSTPRRTRNSGRAPYGVCLLRNGSTDCRLSNGTHAFACAAAARRRPGRRTRVAAIPVHASARRRADGARRRRHRSRRRRHAAQNGGRAGGTPTNPRLVVHVRRALFPRPHLPSRRREWRSDRAVRCWLSAGDGTGRFLPVDVEREGRFTPVSAPQARRPGGTRAVCR